MIRRLFSPLPLSPPRRRAAQRLRAVLPLTLALTALALAAGTRRIEGSRLTVAPTPGYDAWLALRPTPGELPLEVDRAAVPQPFSLSSGQTLGGLLGELGLAPPEVHAAVAALPAEVDVRKIRPGEAGVAYFDAEGRLATVRLDFRGRGRAELRRRDAGWRGAWRDFERETRIRRVAGELDGFLENAIRKAGGRPQLAYGMSDVLQWDLDFNRDLRLGDRFRVLYEEIYLDGDYHGPGEVLALGYTNRGQELEAYRYGDGYYDAGGRPLRKMFLRSPLRFSRVTSRFSNRRFHPVLKVHRPHYGVDYGAPRGTPVRVTANGVVTFVGRNGGGGKMVKVRHPNGYLSAYLHLSGYGPGVRRGKRVSQGDTIGYVGATGLATAPHLDYRIRKDGRWIDPLRLKSEPAEPVPPGEMPAFLAERDRLRAALGGEWPAAAPPEATPRQIARHPDREGALSAGR